MGGEGGIWLEYMVSNTLGGVFLTRGKKGGKKDVVPKEAFALHNREAFIGHRERVIYYPGRYLIMTSNYEQSRGLFLQMILLPPGWESWLMIETTKLK